MESPRKLKRLFADTDGQASIEYVLMLAIAVSLAVLVMRKLLKPLFGKLNEVLAKRMEGMLSSGNLHQIKLSR
jgi:Flp pilus assembly pilin Flp